MAAQPFAPPAPARPFLARLRRLRNRHVFLVDVVVLLLSPVLALAIRIDGFAGIGRFYPALGIYVIGSTVLSLAIYAANGLYKRYWRYATTAEMIQIISAVAMAGAACSLVYWSAIGLHLIAGHVARSLPVESTIITLLGVGGVRLMVCAANAAVKTPWRHDADRVLIVGAGPTGQMVVRDLTTRPSMNMMPIGFLDDQYNHKQFRLMALKVFGAIDDLVRVVEEQSVDQVVIALPDATGAVIRGIMDKCGTLGVPARTVPSLSAIAGGHVGIKRLREVDIEDLLRRPAVVTDTDGVRRLIAGKRVLVTGAGGSIGSELCRQVMNCAPSALALLGHGENSVFEIHNELNLRNVEAQRTNGSHVTELVPYIADIRMARRINSVFSEFKPDIVFHAAAHKHVPLMELNATEAIANNVFGTRIVLDAALENGVQHFVMISTDKVVRPENVMGASKRAAELLVLKTARETGRNFVVVRFGNVLGSRGSVVPTFKKQIERGGPVLVSDRDMKRYFMTIPEAVQLVLQAAILGRGGEVFMLDMGDPVRIVDLANDLIRLSGLEPGKDIEIQFTGRRPGEKLEEELLLDGDTLDNTAHPKVRSVRPADGMAPDITRHLQEFDAAVRDDDAEGVVACLRALIPEFKPDDRRWKVSPYIEAVCESLEDEADHPRAQPGRANGSNGSHA